MDLTELADDELDQHRREVLVEQERRQTLATAPEQADTLARRYLDAEGAEPGQVWRQPTGAHDAYPEGWTVEHGGTTWTSLTPANTWEPGVSGWREVTEEGDAPAEWVRPSGAHDAYQPGDRVTFEGSVYESIHPTANTWSPSEHAPAWQLIE